MVMKGRRSNNLYYVNGISVTRAMTTVSGSDGDSEITSLWHRCLKHAGEIVNMYMHDLGKGHWLAVKWNLRPC